MEIKHSNGGGAHHLTVGVEIPNKEDFVPTNYVYEKQTVHLKPTNYQREIF